MILNSRRAALAVVLLTLVTALATADAAGQAYFVSPDGKDDNPGTQADPFLTLTRARDAVRALPRASLAQGEVTVWVRGGHYYPDKAFELAAADSGTENVQIVYRAYDRERPVLSGGQPISGFAPVSAPYALERLKPEANIHVLQADLKAQGITDYGRLRMANALGEALPDVYKPDFAWPAAELVCSGRIMTLARWPNDAFARIDQLWPLSLGPVLMQSQHKKGERMAFRFAEDDPKRWAQESDPWTFGYHENYWDDWLTPIDSVDPEQRVIWLTKEYGGSVARNRPWYGLNLLCELDSPGEYYIDRTGGVLYFWPPSPTDAERVTLSMLDTLVKIDQASHVTLRGLVFEACRGTALIMKSGRNNTIAGCTVRNTGHMGMLIEGGTEHRVLGCDIYDTGSTGLSISGGDLKRLIRADHLVENNHIYNVARHLRSHRPAIIQQGVGIYLRRNTMHDIPGQGLISMGSDNLFELNEMWNATYESRDSAFLIPSHVVIRWNFLHHLYAGSAWTRMIYMDHLANGCFIFGNVFYGCYGGQAIHLGGSNYNHIDNNIFVDCHPALWIDSRLNGIWSPAWMGQVDYKSPPWSVRYPEYMTIMEEGLAGKPKFNRVTRNICWGDFDDQVDTVSRRVITMKDNRVFDHDPGFADAANLNLQLTQEAEQRLRDEIDFMHIPFEQIGCYEDELRASWPVPRQVKPDRPRQHVIEVPRLAAPVTLDGSLAEWEGIPRCPIDMNMHGGFLSLTWNPDGLYGAIEAKDATLKTNPDVPWWADHTVVYVEPDCARRKELDDNCVYFDLSPQPALDTHEACISSWDRDDKEAGWATERSVGQNPAGVRAFWQPSPTGYTMEFFIPAPLLKAAALQSGKMMGFYSQLADDNTWVEALYAPEFPCTPSPFTWGRIQLVEDPRPSSREARQ